jgi:hypothetical protein
VEQGVLALHVVVEVAGRHPQLAGDLGHLGAAVAAPGEHGGCRPNEVLEPVLGKRPPPGSPPGDLLSIHRHIVD